MHCLPTAHDSCTVPCNALVKGWLEGGAAHWESTPEWAGPPANQPTLTQHCSPPCPAHVQYVQTSLRKKKVCVSRPHFDHCVWIMIHNNTVTICLKHKPAMPNIVKGWERERWYKEEGSSPHKSIATLKEDNGLLWKKGHKDHSCNYDMNLWPEVSGNTLVLSDLRPNTHHLRGSALHWDSPASYLSYLCMYLKGGCAPMIKHAYSYLPDGLFVPHIVQVLGCIIDT